MFPSSPFPSVHVPAGAPEEDADQDHGFPGRTEDGDMMPETLTRKGVQLQLEVWKEAMRRKRAKEKKLADAGKAREVTVSEVIAEAFGMKV